MPSADYNRDGKVSYAEAHAFAKVDEETTDWPISTSESWLQRQLEPAAVNAILSQPMEQWWALARAEQRYVITSLMRKLSLNPKLSYVHSIQSVTFPASNTIEEAYHMRLQMELTNVAAEALIRDSQNPEAIAILEKILGCEAGTLDTTAGNTVASTPPDSSPAKIFLPKILF